MFAVNVDIIRFVETAYPGWVECKLVDAWGCEWMFIEKMPVVTTQSFDSNSSLPQPGMIACEITERRHVCDGREIFCIDTEKSWDVKSTDGSYRFEVLPDQVVKIG